MELDEAREIAAEHGVEEGAQFNWHAKGEIAATITITEVIRSGAGIRDVKCEYDTGEKVVEESATIRNVAKNFNLGYWSTIDE